MPMKIKKYLQNNEGFTLVELIICIAIIVIMTGASYITLSVLHTAKAKEAASTFESALADVVSKDKNVGVDYNLDGTIDSSEEKYQMGVRIYKKGSKVYLQKCVFIAQSNGSYAHWNLGADDSYIKSINDNNDGKGTCLSRYVTVEYISVSGTKYSLGTYSDYTICFNKRGECVTGYGTYNFKDTKGATISSIQINKNGSYIVSGSKER